MCAPLRTLLASAFSILLISPVAALNSQTIAFGTLAGKTYGSAPFTVSATASSGLAITFTSLTTSVCTVSTSTVTLLAAGTCTIRAAQAGNASFAAAPSVNQSFVVAKSTQAITFAALAGRTYGTAPFVVTATATSGLAISFSSTTVAVCTVSGTSVTIVAAGTCSVQAAQAGNLYTAAAPVVQQTITVNPSVAVITAPTKGSTLTGNSAMFTWTKQTGATSYQIWVGTTAGAKDITTVGSNGLSATAGSLPTNGITLYVSLYAYVNGVWTVKDTATYKAGNQTKAVITNPTKGSTLTGSSATFTWSAETGATSYQLWLGTAAGLHDISSTGTSALTVTVAVPTNGSQVYVTLQGFANGVWAVQDTATYTASTLAKAAITSPAKLSLLHGSSVTFTWSAQTGATSYQLWVGTGPGLNNIASKGTSTRSVNITGLPTNGSTIYVTLQGYAGGAWSVQDTTTYTTGP